MIMFPLILIIFCSFLYPPTTVCFNNQTDFLSLLAFKTSLEDPLGSLHSWNQTLHFCSWEGIRCSKNRVVEINLESQGLVGPLSPHLANLSLLTTINLQRNSFHGQIPPQIALLTRLEHLDLRGNSFVGSIPRNLSRCPNLVYLDLIGNNLSGNIPNELGSLSKLQVLNLGSNKFSGKIPQFIGNISSLMKLSLVSCDFYGEIPESLARLQTLTLLQLGENRLNGTIPDALFNISSLQYLGFRKNRLYGVLPSTIGLTLPNLTHLYLSDNHFSGSIPVTISNASFLQELVLNSNEFTGPIPRVEKLTHLRDLVLILNHIEDDISFIISSLTNSSYLRSLQVDANLLTGSLPESISNLSTRLRTLSLGSNRVHGNIPSGIGSLASLNRLSVFDNDLDGLIPLEMTMLSNLLFLSVGKNKFLGELPSSIFQNFTLLTKLFLGRNSFSGNVPTSLGNCTNLLELDFNRNNFSGFIPPQIMNLPSISILLDLSYNSFHGLIPEQVGSLTHVGTLDLSNNRLSGSIPNSLAKCLSLETLNLEENLLEGEIPQGLSALMGLQYLDLSRNNLSSRIPSFLDRLNLEYLNLSFNRLQGEVPTAGVFKDITAVSLEGNEQLCGGISELDLPSCPPPLFKSQKKKLSTSFKILIPTLISGGVLIVCFIKFVYKRRMWGRNETPSVPVSIGVQYFIRLSYADLLKATGGFSEANLLGTGRFGSVYKGVLDDGQTLVAVKVLNLFVRGASKSFMAECNALRGIRHRNLLKILSVCESIDFQGNDFKALVYEYKANGSLEKWLHAETGRLNAIQRLYIALDIAQAIEYLHFGTDMCVVHGDLKPSNILLDSEMSACVGDFGIAKIVSASHVHESYSSIGIRGTIGYVPPEYGTSNSVSTQGDVYSFGVVLLEMFTNKRPTDDLGSDHANLHSFVEAGLPDRAMELIDPRLGREANKKMKEWMAAVLSIGVVCTNGLPRERMSMKDVVNELHKIQKLCNREFI